MKKAVIIDDERPALMELEYMLKQYKEISVVGAFTNPMEALASMEELKPDVVFLDINMPQLMGIDAASAIQEANPAVEVIFVTAYDQYAIEAFELHALDYLLKPINDQRFLKTMDRILKARPANESEPDRSFVIKCLGGFQAGWNNKESIKWRADKTKEIFAYLLQNRGRDISKEELLDQLWPEDDPEKAIRQLYNGIYYIRKAMEDYGVDRETLKIDKDYHIRLGKVELDTEYFYHYGKNKGKLTIEELEKIVERYGGNYLHGEYYPWADFERVHLEQLYLKCILELSEKLIQNRQWEKAEAYLISAYNSSPYEEDITEHLVQLYIESGNKNKALRHYNGYSELIMRELGVKPDSKLQKMIRDIN